MLRALLRPSRGRAFFSLAQRGYAAEPAAAAAADNGYVSQVRNDPVALQAVERQEQRSSARTES